MRPSFENNVVHFELEFTRDKSDGDPIQTQEKVASGHSVGRGVFDESALENLSRPVHML